MIRQQTHQENKTNSLREIAQAKSVLTSLPRRLMVVLTGACNLDCIMCERRASSFTLPPAILEQVSALFPYLDSVMWQGGEVFLVDYFKELFCRAAGYPQLLQEINTNGLLLNQEWARLISAAKVRLILSIDSTEKNTYEYIRKNAKFEKLLENLALLKAALDQQGKTNAGNIINVVVMRCNYRSLENFIEFASKYGFGGINFMFMVGKKCPGENIFEPSDEEALNYLRQSIPAIIQKAASSGINVSCEFSGRLGQNQKQPEPPAAKTEGLFCTMPWRSLFIDGAQEGKVFPECVCLKPLGDIAANSLEQIWNNQSMQQYRKRIAKGELEGWCNPNCIKGMVNKDFLQER